MLTLSTILLASTASEFVMSIIQTALISGGVLYLVIKHFLEQRAKQSVHKNEVETKITESDIENQRAFQQEIVYKSFDAYVEQNNKVMTMFSDQIDKLEEQMKTLEKTQLSNFSQGDVIRREIQSLKNVTNGDLKEIKGLLINHKNLGENIKQVAELLQKATEAELKLTKLIEKQTENNKNIN